MKAFRVLCPLTPLIFMACCPASALNTLNLAHDPYAQKFLILAAGEIITTPPQEYGSKNLELLNIVADVKVDVEPSGPTTVQLSGSPQRVNDTRISEDGKGTLVISSKGTPDSTGPLNIQIKAPRGADVGATSFVGSLSMGNTGGALDLNASSVKLVTGRLSKASISVAGNSDINISEIAGQTDLTLHGSTTAKLGRLRDFQSDLSGNADVSVEDMQGICRIKITGAGSVRVAHGIANPFWANIVGYGSIYFGGKAVNPHIEGVGSGLVHLNSYSGKLDNQGMVEVEIGDR